MERPQSVRRPARRRHGLTVPAAVDAARAVQRRLRRRQRDGCRRVSASTGQWLVRNQLSVQFGDAGGHAGAGRLQRRRRMDVAVYRPSTGHVVRAQPVRGAVWRSRATCRCPATTTATGVPTSPSTGRRPGSWYVRNQLACAVRRPGRHPRARATTTATASPTSRSTGRQPGSGTSATCSPQQFGEPGYVPVPGDYDGDGMTDLAVFRASTATWIVRNQFVGAVRRRDGHAGAG